MYMRLHPQILGLSERSPAMGKKEVRFFDKIRGYIPEIDRYMIHFPLFSELKKDKPDLDRRYIVGESTPNYIRYPESAGRMRALFPGMKVMMLLRNPIDRAYSHYQHAKRIDGPKQMYTNGLSYETFVDAEEAILRTCDHLRLKLKEFSTCYSREAGKGTITLKLLIAI